MRHRPSPSASLLVLLLACVATLVGPRPVRADGEQTKEFTAENFKMTVPAGWTFQEPAAADREFGYVTVVKRVVSPGVEVSAWVLVRDAGGSGSVTSMFAQVKENKQKALADTKVEEHDVSWSGAGSSRMMKIVGKAANGSVIASYIYAGIVSGKYHQLELKCTNGAHAEIAAEVEAVAKGYRFLAGAVADEDPAPPAPGGDAPPGDAPPGDTPAAADPRVRRMDGLGLTWTLPKEYKAPEIRNPQDGTSRQPEAKWGFGSEGKPGIKKGEQGLVCLAGLVVDDETVVTVRVIVQKEQPGATPQGFVRNEGNFEDDAKNFKGSAIPNIDDDCTIGNWRGASRSLKGVSQATDKPLFLKFYFAVLKGVVYQIVVIADDKAEQTHDKWIKATVQGLVWDDTNEGVRGPWVTPFPSYTAVRTDGMKVSKKNEPFSHSTMSMTLQPEWIRLKFSATVQGFETYVTAAETRAQDAYAFVSVQKFPADAFTRQKKEPESLIDDHEGAWSNEMSDPKTRENPKTNKKPSSFKGGKGASYEFSGTKDGQPFVERGWVVKSGQNVFWVKIQLGGKAGDSTLGPLAKKLVDSIKFP